MKHCYFMLNAKGIISIAVQESREFEYGTLSDYVDGCIEIVKPMHLCLKVGDPDLRLVVDDGGKLKRKDLNGIASLMYAPLNDVIVGNVILCKEIMTDDGPDVGLFTKQEAQVVAHAIRDLGYAEDFFYVRKGDHYE